MKEQPDITWYRAIELVIDPEAPVKEKNKDEDDDEDDMRKRMKYRGMTEHVMTARGGIRASNGVVEMKAV